MLMNNKIINLLITLSVSTSLLVSNGTIAKTKETLKFIDLFQNVFEET